MSTKHDNVSDHVKEVFAWLDENVAVYETPSSLTLSGFQVNSARYEGSFLVQLDAAAITRRFSFHLSGNGKPAICPPMFTSPLGAPASYAAVELTDETYAGIHKLLESLLPAMRPLGLNRDIDQLIFHGTPLQDRVFDQAAYSQAFLKLEGMSFTLNL